MCPFSGLTQLLVIVIALILLCHSLLVNAARNNEINNKNVTVHMDQTILINNSFLLNYAALEDPTQDDINIQCKTLDENIAFVSPQVHLDLDNDNIKFNLTGVFLGKTVVKCKDSKTGKIISPDLDVIVIRKKRIIDTVFTASVAILVSIIYINFGCFLNWDELFKNIKRPIGPVIGFCGQFLLMPLLSFGLGRFLFPESPEMQLGMFFTGVSPAGGASNIWTLVLEGNADLSITMTTISTLAAFLMMPLWIFSLGKIIFDDAKLGVPYHHIANYAICLIIPLMVGYLLKKYCPRVANFMARILKGFSSLLILFIIIFAIATNLYLFKLFSWKIIVAGMGLPYLGFIIAYIIAKLLKQSSPDCLAISIETGIQNTGIAIFLLRFSLNQPAADLTTVAPVAVAMMTPLPLMILYIIKRINNRLNNSRLKTLKMKGTSEETKGMAIISHDNI